MFKVHILLSPKTSSQWFGVEFHYSRTSTATTGRQPTSQQLNMLPRQAAFRLLRRIAFQDFKSSPRIEAFQKPISRPLHFFATPSLRNAIKPFEIPRKTTEAPADQPAYEMTFTCKPCSTRSTHRVSKQGYHKGSVLISCPGCKNRHVISDHLNVSSAIA